MDVTVLVVDSNYEPATLAAFQYREKHVYPYLASNGFALRKFQGPLARRLYVAPEARKPEVEYMTGVGHGLLNLYTGNHGDVVFQVGNYDPAEAHNKIVHFLSCQTGAELGPDFVRNGCRAYFGYDVNFVFTFEDQDIFFKCDSEIDRAFADGLTAQKVYERVCKVFDREIRRLLDAGKIREAAILETDRDHLRCPSSGGANWGDTNARLS